MKELGRALEAWMKVLRRFFGLWMKVLSRALECYITDRNKFKN